MLHSALIKFSEVGLMVDQVPQSRLETSRTRAVQYLESQLNATFSDPYALSIITYALTLANSRLADIALQQLNALAVIEGGFV